MPTVIPVAATNPDNPRYSATFSYLGRHDRSIEVDILCPTWDTEPVTTVVTIEVQQSFDNGDTWENIAILQANAQQRGRHGNMPTLTCQVNDQAGSRLGRGKLTVSALISVGVAAVVV